MSLQAWWRGLGKSQQTAVVVLAGIELILTTTALLDLARRPAGQVRGPKSLWALAAAIQPVGPVAYLALGRHPAPIRQG